MRQHYPKHSGDVGASARMRRQSMTVQSFRRSALVKITLRKRGHVGDRRPHIFCNLKNAGLAAGQKRGPDNLEGRAGPKDAIRAGCLFRRTQTTPALWAEQAGRAFGRPRAKST